MTTTPIFDAVAAELGIDLSKPFTLPPTPAFSILGYKTRKRLAGETNRVLREAGFGDTKELKKQ